MTITPGFKGNQFVPGSASYKRANNLYATSSYQQEHNMNPGEILQPTDTGDIQDVVNYATKVGKAIAIRSGGHQYSGASSTGPNNLQLDLKPTFRRPKIDLQLIRDPDNDKVYVRSSVSWTLSELYDFLLDNGVFMPTGQCSTVCLGGHIQTGGYGMLARSFGLLGDYIVELEIVDHTGSKVIVTKKDHPDLFYGFLGGSPGNMGVLTHFKVEVQEDCKHQGSKGLWVAFYYKKETLKSLLDILVEKAEDPNFDRNYDLGVNIVSRQLNLLDLFPGSEDELKDKLPDDVFDGEKHITDLLKFKYALSLVYVQWVNFGTNQFSPELFDRIKKVAKPVLTKEPENYPMSRIAAMWLFGGAREFPQPYVKRTKTTNSKSLKEDGWAHWFTNRIDEVLSKKGNGLWVSSQLQAMGGTNSMLRKNASDSTAYSWRDATVGGTWDVFYQDGKKEAAENWQKENDKGTLVYFSKDDRRLLWGSYGDWDMKNVWQFYYEPKTYEKLQRIRKQADPNGTFTPNPFSVEKAK